MVKSLFLIFLYKDRRTSRRVQTPLRYLRRDTGRFANRTSLKDGGSTIAEWNRKKLTFAS